MEAILIKRICVGTLCALMAMGASSQTYLSYNSLTCGDFMSQRSNEAVVGMASEYIRGYFSAHNVFSGRKQITASYPNSTLGLWLEKFCREHPLANIQEAAPALVAEITGPLGPPRRRSTQ
ncbi:MAG: hypothetical protein EOO23_04605 [Comamonadaceae bacterium]|nr:MAG: hypothetical protein EOO23_04605 [Comamonadaceae bacterium]